MHSLTREPCALVEATGRRPARRPQVPVHLEQRAGLERSRDAQQDVGALEARDRALIPRSDRDGPDHDRAPVHLAIDLRRERIPRERLQVHHRRGDAEAEQEGGARRRRGCRRAAARSAASPATAATARMPARPELQAAGSARPAASAGTSVRTTGSRRDASTQRLEARGTDPGDLAEVVDRVEAAVLGPPRDDARRERWPDAVEPVELLDRRRVEVDDRRSPRAPAAAGCTAPAAPRRGTVTISPSASRTARLSWLRSAVRSAPPARLSASRARLPAGRTSTPGSVHRTHHVDRDGAELVIGGSPPPRPSVSRAARSRRLPRPAARARSAPAPPRRR